LDYSGDEEEEGGRGDESVLNSPRKGTGELGTGDGSGDGKGEEPMDTDSKEGGKEGNGEEEEEVFLREMNKNNTPNEREERSKEKDKDREQKIREQREEEKRIRIAQEEAATAKELGREFGSRMAKAKVDPRYKQVRVERADGPQGREMNRKVREDEELVLGTEMAGFLFQDERWLRNYSIHNTDRAVNVSCSINPKTSLCYTCIGEPHKAWEGRGGEPITVILTDQHFPANTPAMDGGECFRIIRVEDGSLRELVEEFGRICKRWMLAPGSMIMFGSVSAMARSSTQDYAQEWKAFRNQLLAEYQKSMIVPVLPLAGEAIMGEHVVRSLVEFFDWYDDLQDPEARLLRSVRRAYVAEFLDETEEGERWGDQLQNHRMPISLHGEGTTRYRSRLYGRLPRAVRGVDEHEEQVWIGRIGSVLNRDFGMSLTTSVVAGRSLAAVRAVEEQEDKLSFKVIGASNATRSAAALARKGMVSEKCGQRGWSLAVEKDVEALLEELEGVDMSGKVILFHCMDNGTFMSLDRAGMTSLPRKSKGVFHIPGKLVVATGYVLEQMVETMVRIATKVKPGLVEIILPMPRYLEACCQEHAGGRTADRLKEEQERVIRSVLGMKKEVAQLCFRMRIKNVVIVSPLEVLEPRGSTAVSVRSHMDDGVHMNERSLDKVMDHAIQMAEEFFVTKNRGPTERGPTGAKRSRFASMEGPSGSNRGGRMGGNGGWSGGRGRNHSHY